MGLAAEELVGRPAGEKCSHDAEHFSDAHHRRGGLDAQASVLGEECRAPVQDGEADDVDEEVGGRENPDDRVLEHHLLDESLVGEIGELLRLCDDFLDWSVVVNLLRIRQPY